jgi:hypothetical protein
MTVKELWRRWTIIARAIGEFQSRLILTIFYFFIMGPVALCVRIFSDPLRLKIPSRVTWSPVDRTAPRNIDEAKKQF